MKKYKIREKSIADYAIKIGAALMVIAALSIPSTIEHWMGWL